MHRIRSYPLWYTQSLLEVPEPIIPEGSVLSTRLRQPFTRQPVQGSDDDHTGQRVYHAIHPLDLGDYHRTERLHVLAGRHADPVVRSRDDVGLPHSLDAAHTLDRLPGFPGANLSNTTAVTAIVSPSLRLVREVYSPMTTVFPSGRAGWEVGQRASPTPIIATIAPTTCAGVKVSCSTATATSTPRAGIR